MLKAAYLVRRANPRAPFFGPLICSHPDSQAVEARILNISDDARGKLCCVHISSLR